jgi:hypothetical protein
MKATTNKPESFNMAMRWRHTDPMRGYSEFKYAVVGGSDAGEWEDSPAPSHITTRELNGIKQALKKEHIKYRETAARSSNVFMIKRYVVVQPSNLDRAKQIARDWLATNENHNIYVIGD